MDVSLLLFLMFDSLMFDPLRERFSITKNCHVRYGVGSATPGLHSPSLFSNRTTRRARGSAGGTPRRPPSAGGSAACPRTAGVPRGERSSCHCERFTALLQSARFYIGCHLCFSWVVLNVSNKGVVCVRACTLSHFKPTASCETTESFWKPRLPPRPEPSRPWEPSARRCISQRGRRRCSSTALNRSDQFSTSATT